MKNNFIEVYENVLSEEVCEYLIKTFEDSPDLHTFGKVGDGNTDLEIKSSMDMNLLQALDKQPGLKGMILGNIRKHLDESIIKYFKKYPYTQRAPFDKECTDKEIVDHLRSNYSFWSKSLMMKKYNKGKDGFHAFHEDCGVQFPTIARTLVCMYYLNDVEEGGETEFYHQQLKVKPTRGSLVIFPAYFTHLHKGHIPISNNKYIMNIWLMKNNAPFWRIQNNKNK